MFAMQNESPRSLQLVTDSTCNKLESNLTYSGDFHWTFSFVGTGP